MDGVMHLTHQREVITILQRLIVNVTARFSGKVRLIIYCVEEGSEKVVMETLVLSCEIQKRPPYILTPFSEAI